MWGGLIFAAKCGEKCLIVLINFSLKVAAKLQKTILNPLKLEHLIDSARKHTHTQPHTTILADSNMNIKPPQREWNKPPRRNQISRTKII